MCRRYEPDELGMSNLLLICEDPRDSCEIETREQLNPFGQQLLKDFEDGVISSEMLGDRAFAKLHGQAEEEDNNQPRTCEGVQTDVVLAFGRKKYS